MRPMTLNHPPPRADGLRLLDAATAPKHAVGTSGENVRQDGEFMRAPIAVFDAKAVAQIQKGKRGLSNGYTAKLDFTPGIAPDGKPYDAIQREIRGDHIAIVDVPRAGEVAQIRLDGNQETEDEESIMSKMTTVKLDGIDYEAAPEVANALAKAHGERDSLQLQLQTVGNSGKEALDKLTAERDALKEKLDAAEKRDVRAEVKARVALETTARKILPESEHEKLDDMDDAAIRKAVVASRWPELKLDDKSEAYLQSRFEIAIEDQAAERTDEARRADALAAQRSKAAPRHDAATPRDAVIQSAMDRINNQWRPDYDPKSHA
jgi:hypothetical protein